MERVKRVKRYGSREKSQLGEESHVVTSSDDGFTLSHKEALQGPSLSKMRKAKNF